MRNQSLSYRLILNGLLFVSVLFFPWWVSIVLMFVLLLVAEAYEVLLWGLFIDVLYSAPVPFYGNIPLLFTLFSLFLLMGMRMIKRQLIFYTE